MCTHQLCRLKVGDPVQRDFLMAQKVDKLHQWTGQTIVSYNTNAVQYVILGPDRLFKTIQYCHMDSCLVLVLSTSIISLHRLFPKSKLKFHLWNTTVFLFYYEYLLTFQRDIFPDSLRDHNNVLGIQIQAQFMEKYNYLLAAAFGHWPDLSILLIFLFFSAGKQSISRMVGNNGKSVERCFAMS